MTDLKGGIPVQIMADLAKTDTIFSDVVTIESCPDNVIISFVQSYPSGRAENVPDEIAGNIPVERIGKIVSRVVLTWPHFARVVGHFQKTLNDGKDIAKDNFINSVIGDSFSKENGI